jgi:hypothetical protein
MSRISEQWSDFNTADDANIFELIPNNTLAKVRMTIRPGGYNDETQGWTGGYATQGKTGAVFLACEYVIIGGKYDKQKVWGIIGLHSDTGPKFREIGRSFIKSIINSSRGLNPKDLSEPAQKARIIAGIHSLDGIVFLAKITIGKNQEDNLQNEIKMAITPDHTEYSKLMTEDSRFAIDDSTENGSFTPPWA